MPHARLSHSTRPTLEFRQSQVDEDRREAVGNIMPLLADGDPPLVHIETRERERSIRGRVTAPRRAANDGTTSDWLQALANYVDLLESHLTEFQGDGYTFTDDIRSESFRVIYHSLEWTLSPGSPYEFEFDVGLSVGRGALESRAIQQRDPTVNTSMTVPATVGGHDLPGLRDLRVSRSFAKTVKPVYDKTSAQNNDVIGDEGVRHEFVYEGTHTGSNSARATADANLAALEGTQATLKTRFPGYSLDGYVLNYDSNLEARFGTNSHHFTLRFIEGEPA